MMLEWRLIETAPKDGQEVLCWASGWDRPTFLIWKTNRRIVSAHKQGHSLDWAESYWGDLYEDDDYEFAAGEQPTHWLHLELPDA